MATQADDSGSGPGRFGPPASPPAFVVLKLKPGWALDGGAVRRRGRRVVPPLPAGAALAPALALVPPAHGRSLPAERELARFVHLCLAPGSDAAAALALARGWDFVERAELPPPGAPPPVRPS